MSTARKVWLWVSVLLNLGGFVNALAPASAFNPFGLVLSGPALELLRFVGILQISIGVLSFAALKVTSADGRRAIDLCLFVGYILGLPYIIYENITIGLGVMVFVQGAITVVLGGAFGYSLFSGRSAEAGQQPAKRAVGR